MYAAPRSTRQVGVFLFADGDDPDDALSTSGLVLPLPPLTVVVVDEDDDDADVVALLASSSASPPDRRGAASCSAAIVWLQRTIAHKLKARLLLCRAAQQSLYLSFSSLRISHRCLYSRTRIFFHFFIFFCERSANSKGTLLPPLPWACTASVTGL